MDMGRPPRRAPRFQKTDFTRGLDLDTWFVGHPRTVKYPRKPAQGVRTQETELSRAWRSGPWTYLERPRFRLYINAKMMPSYKEGWWFGKPLEKLDANWLEVIIPYEPPLKGHGVPILRPFSGENGPQCVVNIMVPGLNP